MITVMVNLKVKETRLTEFKQLATELTEETRNVRDGCISYSFAQDPNSKTEFILFEQWRDQASLDTHIQHLFAKLGPAIEGKPLPKKLLDFYESAAPKFYNAIG